MNFLVIVWMVTGIVAALRNGNFIKAIEKEKGWDAIGTLLVSLAGLVICAALGPFAFVGVFLAMNDQERNDKEK